MCTNMCVYVQTVQRNLSLGAEETGVGVGEPWRLKKGQAPNPCFEQYK